MERLQIKVGDTWQGEKVTAVCHFGDMSVVIRRDTPTSEREGTPRYAVQLLTDHSAAHNESYRSYYGRTPYQVPEMIERCIPRFIGESSR